MMSNFGDHGFMMELIQEKDKMEVHIGKWINSLLSDLKELDIWFLNIIDRVH